MNKDNLMKMALDISNIIDKYEKSINSFEILTILGSIYVIYSKQLKKKNNSKESISVIDSINSQIINIFLNDENNE